MPGAGKQAEEVGQPFDDETYDGAECLTQPLEESFYPHLSLSQIVRLRCASAALGIGLLAGAESSMAEGGTSAADEGRNVPA
ncbi:hypothetical protein Pstu01_12470 [Stutzerimonas stutzeri]|nr:hypothetical protein Pstu01_12470 [Stutzerimonas stutzeri]